MLCPKCNKEITYKREISCRGITETSICQCGFTEKRYKKIDFAVDNWWRYLYIPVSDFDICSSKSSKYG